MRRRKSGCAGLRGPESSSRAGPCSAMTSPLRNRTRSAGRWNVQLNIALGSQPAYGGAECIERSCHLVRTVCRRYQPARSAHEINSVGQHRDPEAIDEIRTACSFEVLEAELVGVEMCRVDRQPVRILEDQECR